MKKIEEIQQLVKSHLASLDWRIEPCGLYEPIEYVLSLGGKRIRPVLALLSCQLFDENIEKAIYPALGIEVFHNFTLLHDDVMDKADMRRGNPTVHKKWNENTAILSGDAMSFKAYELLAKCDPSVFKSIFDAFTETSLDVFEGQQYDMEFETRNDVTIPEYIEMIRLKTAVLLAGSLKIGALCGGASERDADLIYKYGIGIGLAFQIKDDLLDVYGDEKKFGKAIGGDINCNKKTFLLITALEKSDAASKASLMDWISREKFDRTEKVKAVTAIYDKLDVRTNAESAMRAYYEDALNALRQISVAEELKQPLYDLANNLLYRED
ncbi:MAG: polyprenyl synthetase family protein [Paludibacteraceae bacterium]|nr:polyprenyl synthetase family protein [Paludibacteraceae bacterium]